MNAEEIRATNLKSNGRKNLSTSDEILQDALMFLQELTAQAADFNVQIERLRESQAFAMDDLRKQMKELKKEITK